MTLDPDQAIKAKIPLIFIVTRFYNLFVIDYRFPASLNDREFLVQQALARQFYHDMLLAREFELAPAEQYTQGNIGGFLHLYPGEEAVAVGSLRASHLTRQTLARLFLLSIA